MDYSKLSDFEIANRVANTLPGRYVFYPDTQYVMDSETEESFDPCNNPADAWPIIQNSGISLVYDGDDWLALHFSRTSLTYPNDHRKHPDKPFRAALILWLMMQESE